MPRKAEFIYDAHGRPIGIRIDIGDISNIFRTQHRQRVTVIPPSEAHTVPTNLKDVTPNDKRTGPKAGRHRAART